MSIRTRIPFLADRPVSEPFQIIHIVDTLMGRVNLRPVYQRGISWTLENMCDLVSTVMHNGLLPGLLLYIGVEGGTLSPVSWVWRVGTIQ